LSPADLFELAELRNRRCEPGSPDDQWAEGRIFRLLDGRLPWHKLAPGSCIELPADARLSVPFGFSGLG